MAPLGLRPNLGGYVMKLLVKSLISVSGFTGYILLFLTTQITFAAQELKVGFIQGQGNDAAVE